MDYVTQRLLRGETIQASGANAAEHVADDANGGGALLLEAVTAKLVASSTIGTRTVVLEIVDDADEVVALMGGDVTQAQSTTRYHVFARGAGHGTTFLGSVLSRPLPLHRIEPGWTLRVRDSSNVDASGDVLTVTATVHRAAATLS